MHIHLGIAHAIGTFMLVLLIGIPWRIISMRLSQTSIGKAMALAY